jgi:hypothetical protein
MSREVQPTSALAPSDIQDKNGKIARALYTNNTRSGLRLFGRVKSSRQALNTLKSFKNSGLWLEVSMLIS